MLAATVVLTVAAAGVILLRGALVARSSLTAVRSDVSEVRSAIGDGDIEDARARLEDAADEVARARGATDGPLWAIATRVPVIGRSPAVVRATVDVAVAATELGDSLVARADRLITPEGGLAIEVGGDGFDVAALASLGELLDELPIAEVEAARDRLAAASVELVPAEVRDGRREVLTLIDETLGSLERARGGLRVVPDLLGADGPRTYFLAFQNNAELRGTGGLIGLFTTVTFDRGKVSLVTPIDLKAVDDRLEDVTLPPAQVSEEYLDRYEGTDADRLLKNVNVDPDLPTTARVMLDLVAARGGPELDGVLAIDPFGLAEILGGIGPVDLPAEYAGDPRIPDPVPAADLPRVTMVEAYEVFGGGTGERKEFLSAVSEAAFARIFAGDWDAAEVTRRVGRAIASRHLQFFSVREDEEATLIDLGVGGELAPPPDGEDLLALTANNSAANKQDIHVGHGIEVDIALELPGVGDPADTADMRAATRTSSVAVTVDNPLPTTGMHDYILGSAPPGRGEDERLDGPRGLNRTWFSLWSPGSDRLVAARDGDGGAIRGSSGSFRGLQVVDHTMETPSMQRRSFSLDLAGPVMLRRDGDGLVYRLRWWRQAKGIPDDLEIIVRAPEGWEVADADIDGGGRPDRLDFSADARPGPPELAATTQTDLARITGEITADLVIEVRLVPLP